MATKVSDFLAEWVPVWLRRRASRNAVGRVPPTLPESIARTDRIRARPPTGRPERPPPPMRASNM